VILHSTRGGAKTSELEFKATLNWFASTASQVSAHAVIAADGTIANVVNPDLIAWHAGIHNATWLGVELTQSWPGDIITDEQYESLRWWLQQMSARYRFPLDAEHLIQHKDTVQGRAAGKSDIGAPFDLSRVLL
jgi:N-acetylmuramoyl-L-alanine amidase